MALDLVGLSGDRLRLMEAMLRDAGIAGTGAAGVGVVARGDVGAAVGLTFPQQRLWFLEQLGSGGVAYVIPVMLRVRGLLDVEVFRGACDLVVARHESLRTVFFERDGRPWQRVLERVGSVVEVIDVGGVDAAGRGGAVAELAGVLFARPFDLAVGPLLRVQVLRCGVGESVVLLSVHHIVADQWSMSVLVGEVMAAYEAGVAGVPAGLEPLAVQFPDFAAWQAGQDNEAGWAGDLAFWAGRLGGVPAELGLPLDRPRGAEKTYRGGSVPVRLSAGVTAGVRALAHQEQVTPFMVLAAAFDVMLYRYSGNADVVVGTPVANRPMVELEPLIGLFVNTVVLRTDLSGGPSFRELLGRVAGVALDAFDHQGLPFERLVEELAPVRSLAATPLFQVAFSFQNVPFPSLQVGGISAEPLAIESTTAKFDLMLQLFEEGAQIWGTLEYSRDIFDQATATRMAASIGQILHHALADPEQDVDSITILTPDQQDWLVGDGIATAVSDCTAVSDRTVESDRASRLGTEDQVHHLFEAQALRTPTRCAVVDAQRSLTYRELDELANQLAQRLRSAGIGRNAVVGVFLDRSVELVAAMMATTKAGGAYLPLDPDYPLTRLGSMLQGAGTAVLLTTRRLRDLLGDVPIPVVCIDEEAVDTDDVVEVGGAAEPLDDIGSGDDLMYVITTSGSTGVPKPAAVCRSAFTNLVRWYVEDFDLSSDDRVIIMSSPSFDLTQKNFFGPLCAGAEVHLVPQGIFDPRQVAGWIHDKQITVTNTTPSVFGALLEYSDELRSLRVVFLGGEPLLGPPLRELVGASEGGLEVVNTYGPTECTDVVAFHRLAYPADYQGETVPIGGPVPSCRLYVLDPLGAPVPVGVTGELHIGGVCVGAGYLGEPELTQKAFVPDPFAGGHARMYRSGDLARKRPDGLVEYLGRVDHQVKIRGFRIELGEIESALSLHPAVRDVVVVAAPGPDGSNRLVAYVSVEGHPTVGELREFARPKLPDYMVPSAFVLMNTMPLTANGKVDRLALPAADLTQPEVGAVFVAPRDDLEESIAGIWAELLGVERVGVHDSFFELGGHSLLATQLSARIGGVFGADLSLHDFFEAPTVADVACRLRESWLGGTEGEGAIPVITKTGGVQLSFAQHRKLHEHPGGPEDPYHSVIVGLQVSGPLDIPALERALGDIVDRHESLRTRFVRDGDEVFAVVSPAGSWPLAQDDLRSRDPGSREHQLGVLVEAERDMPFALDDGRPVRARVVRMADDEAVLLIAMHHIVTDNWSFGVLVRDLIQFYDARVGGRAPDLPPLPVQYSDIAAWHRERLASGHWDESVEHWREQLRPVPALLPRAFEPADQATEVRTFLLDEDLTLALHEVARSAGASPFIVLLAAYEAMLSVFSGSAEVAVTWPDAGRQRRETVDLIGYFVNPVLTRNDLSDVETFAELIGRVRAQVSEAYAHQHVPLRDPTELERGVPRPFQAAINLLSAPVPDVELLNLKVRPMNFGTGYVFSEVITGIEAVEADLTLVMRNERGRFRGMWMCAADRVDAAWVARMTDQWPALLALLIEDPGQRIAELHQVLAAKPTGAQPASEQAASVHPASEQAAGARTAQSIEG